MKKSFVFALVIGLCALVLSACTTTFAKNGSRDARGAKFGGPEEGQTVVAIDSRFVPGWESFYLYAYFDNGAVTNGSWPGQKMKSFGNGIYYYIMPMGLETANVIFNNGNGDQLPDETIIDEAQMILSEEGLWMPWVHN
jgi:hypothetical protein